MADHPSLTPIVEALDEITDDLRYNPLQAEDSATQLLRLAGRLSVLVHDLERASVMLRGVDGKRAADGNLDPTCEHEWFMDFDSSEAKDRYDTDNMGYRQCCIKCGGHVGERLDVDATLAKERELKQQRGGWRGRMSGVSPS